jgi:hypothetical protein
MFYTLPEQFANVADERFSEILRLKADARLCAAALPQHNAFESGTSPFRSRVVLQSTIRNFSDLLEPEAAHHRAAIDIMQAMRWAGLVREPLATPNKDRAKLTRDNYGVAFRPNNVLCELEKIIPTAPVMIPASRRIRSANAVW